jgi:exosortase
MVCGLVMRLVGIYMRLQTLEGVSMIPMALGVITLIFGRQAASWGAPAVLFLLFMVPLPGFLSGQLSGVLQKIATTVSTFAFQTLGIPAFAEGNIINLSNGTIGVAEACSGLRMLYAFFALTVGACMVIDRAWPEKVIIALSAIPIAIIANCIRIIATGLAYEHFEPETAEHIFHDVAGWLMMPVGFTILLGVLGILDRLIVPDESFPIQSELRQSDRGNLKQRRAESL